MNSTSTPLATLFDFIFSIYMCHILASPSPLPPTHSLLVYVHISQPSEQVNHGPRVKAWILSCFEDSLEI